MSGLARPRKSESQTDPRQALYRLHVSLRVPVDAAARARGEPSRYHWLAEDSTASEGDLHGLVIPALVEGGFLEQVREPEIPCETCQEHGTAAEKKERYNRAGLAAHYKEAHPALSPQEA